MICVFFSLALTIMQQVCCLQYKFFKEKPIKRFKHSTIILMYVGSKQLKSSSCGNVSIFLQGAASARLI